jgi:hypothetical protein
MCVGCEQFSQTSLHGRHHSQPRQRRVIDTGCIRWVLLGLEALSHIQLIPAWKCLVKVFRDGGVLHRIHVS